MGKDPARSMVIPIPGVELNEETELENSLLWKRDDEKDDTAGETEADE